MEGGSTYCIHPGNNQNNNSVRHKSNVDWCFPNPHSPHDLTLHCQSERHERTTSLVVTGTTLTFILLAATMVTITFLMSPVIEEMFGELLKPEACIIPHVFSRQQVNEQLSFSQ